MKKIFLLLLFFIIFNSCNKNEKYKTSINTCNSIENDSSIDELIFYEINNEILVHEIKMYMDSVKYNAKEKIVNISTFQNNDTIIYSINFSNSAFALLMGPIKFFYKVNGKTVVFSYECFNDMMLPDSIVWEYFKETFPEQYNMYRRNKQSGSKQSIPPNDWHHYVVLKFYGGELVDRYFSDTGYIWWNDGSESDLFQLQKP